MVRIILIISFIFLSLGSKAQYVIDQNIHQKLISSFLWEYYISSDSLNSIQEIINLEYNNNFKVIEAILSPIDDNYPDLSFNYALIDIKLITADSAEGFSCIMLIDSLFEVKDFFLINTYIINNNTHISICDAILLRDVIMLYFWKIKNQNYSMHPYMSEELYVREIAVDTLLQKIVY